jgi:CubicO group peptidase (beta-lactamase class C family)
MNRRDFVLTTAAGLAAATLPQAIRAATSIPARVDPVMLQKLVDEVAAELGIVGGQMALFDGTQIHEFSTGMADRERALAVTPDTLFQIGSTTKVFNAATIMSLVDEGVLDLDAPLKTWIKDFKVPDADSTANISLRHLLSMSAGLDNGPYTSYGRGDDALGQYVAAMAEVPVIFPAGTAFGYSNASTNISGYAAQMATGKNWETLLQERILGPLGLKQSANFPEDLLYHPIAIGYGYPEGAETPERVPYWGLPRSMAPAGASLCCSAGDLVRFATMFLRGGKSDSGAQVISGKAVETMHTPQVELPARLTAQQWCTGPYRKTWGGSVIYGHSGTNTGGSSLLLWCPERNIAIATIANVPRQGYPFADRVFSTVFPQVFDIQKPALPKPDTVTPVAVDLERYTGQFDAWGSHIEFVAQGEKLIMNMFAGDERAKPELSTEIIPLGDDRFLPADPAAGGNRGWDVAFWGDEGNGRVTHFLNGVFAMRRTG